MSYVLNLKLGDPNGAQAFVDANGGDHSGAMAMQTWQSILADATDLAKDSQILLLIGAWLLGLLAVAAGRVAPRLRLVTRFFRYPLAPVGSAKVTGPHREREGSATRGSVTGSVSS